MSPIILRGAFSDIGEGSGYGDGYGGDERAHAAKSRR